MPRCHSKLFSTMVRQDKKSLTFAIELIQRLFQISSQPQHKNAIMALDAIRNLTVQAFLIEKHDCAGLILDQGFFALIEQVIRHSIDQLQAETQQAQAQQKKGKGSKQTEQYQVTIEQAFVCLSDICHFLEHGEALQKLTHSELVQKSVRLAINCQHLGSILTIKNFRQLSIFLRELSNDNEYCKSLLSDEFDAFLKAFPVNEENADFYWNLLEFHFNCVQQK